ncbi:MAG: hypothetical protein HQM10_17140 [Candidatus Riflebacteria bacterium]|nr:hypothetical protein [Candidatus Riflebacteria bacterium]
MKKFMVLFLIGLMNIFAVGCWFNDDGDDDVGPATNASNVVLQAKVPADTLNRSIRNALIPTDIQVWMNGVSLDYASTTDGFMIFQKTIDVNDPSFSVVLSAGGGAASLTVQIGTMAPINVTITLDTTTSGSLSKTLSLTITTTNATDGTYSLLVTDGVGISAPVNSVISEKSLGVTAIDYRTLSGNFLPLANATGVPTNSTTIRITFDSVVDKATNNFKINAQSSSGNKVTLMQTDLAKVINIVQTDVPASATPAHSYLDVTLLVNTTEGRSFKPNTTYTLSFESASVCRKDDPSVRLRPTLVFSRTFKTASAN